MLTLQHKDLDEENQTLHNDKRNLHQSLEELHGTSSREFKQYQLHATKTVRDLESRLKELQETVIMTNTTADKLRQELVSQQTQHEIHRENFNQKVSIREMELEKDASIQTKEYDRSVTNYERETKRLERELKAIKSERNTHHDTAVKFAKDLCQVRDVQRRLRIELDTNRKQCGAKEQQLIDAKLTTGSIATLAENLKLEKYTLERKLKQSFRSESETHVQLQYTIKEVAVLNERVTEIEQFHTTRYNKLDTELQEHLMD